MKREKCVVLITIFFNRFIVLQRYADTFKGVQLFGRRYFKYTQNLMFEVRSVKLNKDVLKAGDLMK